MLRDPATVQRFGENLRLVGAAEAKMKGERGAEDLAEPRAPSPAASSGPARSFACHAVLGGRSPLGPAARPALRTGPAGGQGGPGAARAGASPASSAAASPGPAGTPCGESEARPRLGEAGGEAPRQVRRHRRGGGGGGEGTTGQPGLGGRWVPRCARAAFASLARRASSSSPPQQRLAAASPSAATPAAGFGAPRSQAAPPPRREGGWERGRAPGGAKLGCFPVWRSPPLPFAL